jgi:hypothetical protein
VNPSLYVSLFSEQLAPEAALTLLLETLSFSLSDEQVVWKLHMVASPTVDGRLRLPLLVSRNIEQVQDTR